MKRTAQGYLLSLLFLMIGQPTGLSQNVIPSGAIHLTHISPDYNTAADEFVVLYNTTPDTIDLDGHEVRYYTASGSPGSAGRSFAGPTPVPPYGHLLLSPNDTVSVGMVSVLRDGAFTSGMASSGGQLVLRSSAFPDSVVYAAAWGSVTQYVAGMTDAASWASDGMLALVWQDSGYVRSSSVFSNAEYAHVPSDSIIFLPSQAGSVSAPGGIAWSLPVAVVQGAFSDSSVLIGMDTSGTDGFDYFLDYPMPPLPAGSFVAAGVYRPDMNLPTGEHLLRDVRPLRPLSDTTMRWMLDVWPAETGSGMTVSLQLSSLPAYLPVELHDVQSGSRVRRQGDSLSYDFIPATTDPHRFLIVVGDTTPPSAAFTSPSGGERLTVGRQVSVSFSIEEPTGIDSLSLFFQDVQGSVMYAVVDTTVRVETLTWQLPRRLLSDSAQFVVYMRDSMGNASLHASQVFSVVPDTARLSLTPGWHTFSLPLEPIVSHPFRAPEDSMYLFGYLQQRGYAPADTVRPGRGYFLGVMNDRDVILPGIPVIDSLTVPLPAGFSLMSNPTGRTIARDDLLISVGNTQYDYASAIASGVISGGFFGYGHDSGLYHTADSLYPWEAYWIPVLVGDVSLSFPEGGGQGSLRVVNQRRNGWEVRFRAVVDGSADTLFSIGVDGRAADGFDGAHDVPTPPPPPGREGLRVYAEHADWKTPVGTRFLKDIRSGKTPAEWTIVVSAPQGARGTFGWQKGIGDVPDGMMIRRLWPEAGSWELLTEDWICDLDGAAESRFAVRMTVTGSEHEPPNVPAEFGVMANFPNPFNGTTVLSFSIPRRGSLSVRVFDQLGRLVDIIEEREVVPGSHAIAWTAELSSGMYLGEAVFRPAEGEHGATIRRWRMVLLK